MKMSSPPLEYSYNEQGQLLRVFMPEDIHTEMSVRDLDGQVRTLNVHVDVRGRRYVLRDGRPLRVLTDTVAGQNYILASAEVRHINTTELPVVSLSETVVPIVAPGTVSGPYPKFPFVWVTQNTTAVKLPKVYKGLKHKCKDCGGEELLVTSVVGPTMRLQCVQCEHEFVADDQEYVDRYLMGKRQVLPDMTEVPRRLFNL